jgi:hypothetical protein
MSMKISSDTIGNRTRDLPACSTVPQPTAPPRAPKEISAIHEHIYYHIFGLVRPWNFLYRAVLRYACYITITTSAVSVSHYAPRGMLTSHNTINTYTGAKPVLHFTVRTGWAIDWEIRNKFKHQLSTAVIDAYGRKTSELSFIGTNEKDKLDKMGKVTTLASSLNKSALSWCTGERFCSSPKGPDRLWGPSSLQQNVSGSFPGSKFAIYRSG